MHFGQWSNYQVPGSGAAVTPLRVYLVPIDFQ